MDHPACVAPINSNLPGASPDSVHEQVPWQLVDNNFRWAVINTHTWHSINELYSTGCLMGIPNSWHNPWGSRISSPNPTISYPLDHCSDVSDETCDASLEITHGKPWEPNEAQFETDQTTNQTTSIPQFPNIPLDASEIQRCKPPGRYLKKNLQIIGWTTHLNWLYLPDFRWPSTVLKCTYSLHFHWLMCWSKPGE